MDHPDSQMHGQLTLTKALEKFSMQARFLGTHNQAQTIKGKIDKLDFIKIKTALQMTLRK